jgi:ParB/Sulfiredoxin domain
MADLRFQPGSIEQLRIDDLRPYARNPRTHSDDQVAKLAASLVEFGWTMPILVNDELEVIAGHGRILAARRLGLDAVPVIRLAHLTLSAEELDELLAPIGDGSDLVGDPETVPEPPAHPVSRPGDLWLLGPHRLLCGDSTSGDDVTRLMHGERRHPVRHRSAVPGRLRRHQPSQQAGLAG